MQVTSTQNNNEQIVELSAIRSELERILSSDQFGRSESISRFLQFIVEKTLEGQAKTIKQFTLATEVLGLGPDFDPQVDPIVRLKAGQLRRALDNYYANSETKPKVRIEVPKGSYIPRFKWVDAESRMATPIPEASIQDPKHLGLPTIAVLPFRNLGSPDNDHIAIGLSEELAVELAQLKHARVVDFHSSHYASFPDQSATETGRHLNADFIITGNVSELAEKLRLNVKMTSILSGGLAWAKKFAFHLNSHDLNNLFDTVLTEVASEIGDEFGPVTRCLIGAFSEKSSGSTAYDAVLKGIKYELTLDPEDLETAHNALVHATRIAPDFAPAWAHLAQTYLDDHVFGMARFENSLEEGIRCARKAITLDRSYYFCHYGKAFVEMIQHNRQGIASSAEEMLRLNPNAAYTQGVAGFWLAIAGQFERGVELIDNSIELNPHQPSWFFFAYYLLSIHRKSYQEAKEYSELFGLPDFYWSSILRAVACALAGDIKEANKAYRQLLVQKPEFKNKARDLVAVFILSEEMLAQMLEGLAIAGWTDSRST